MLKILGQPEYPRVARATNDDETINRLHPPTGQHPPRPGQPDEPRAYQPRVVRQIPPYPHPISEEILPYPGRDRLVRDVNRDVPPHPPQPRPGQPQQPRVARDVNDRPQPPQPHPEKPGGQPRVARDVNHDDDRQRPQPGQPQPPQPRVARQVPLHPFPGQPRVARDVIGHPGQPLPGQPGQPQPLPGQPQPFPGSGGQPLPRVARQLDLGADIHGEDDRGKRQVNENPNVPPLPEPMP